MPHSLYIWLTQNGNGQDVWTCLFLINFWTIAAIIVSHVKTHRHIKRSNEKTADLLDPTTPGGLGDMDLHKEKDEQAI